VSFLPCGHEETTAVLGHCSICKYKVAPARVRHQQCLCETCVSMAARLASLEEERNRKWMAERAASDDLIKDTLADLARVTRERDEARARIADGALTTGEAHELNAINQKLIAQLDELDTLRARAYEVQLQNQATIINRQNGRITELEAELAKRYIAGYSRAIDVVEEIVDGRIPSRILLIVSDHLRHAANVTGPEQEQKKTQT
jgi:hypothetical protein